MMKILAPHPNTPIPSIQHALIVLMPARIFPAWEKMVTGRTIGQVDYHHLSTTKRILLWVSHVRYGRSNPRGAAYMLGMVSNFFKEYAPDARMDLLVEDSFSTPLDNRYLKSFESVWKGCDIQRLLGSPKVWNQFNTNHYDTVILLYTDPLGLGYGWAERKISSLASETVLALNGRRRMFYWDNHVRIKLTWLRFWDITFIPELLFTIIATLLSIPLALYDGIAALLSLKKAGKQNEG